MRLETFLISFLIFTLIVVTGTLTLVDINTNYGTTISTSDFGNVYNTSAEIYGISQGQKNATLGAEVSNTDPTSSTITGSYSAIRYIGNTFTLMGDILSAISDKLGIPEYFITTALIAVTILIIFAIIYLFLVRYVSP